MNRSSVYKLTGSDLCFVEVANGLSAAEASCEATDRNKTNANGLGLSFRAYRARSAYREGWHLSARGGMAGKRFSEWIRK